MNGPNLSVGRPNDHVAYTNMSGRIEAINTQRKKGKERKRMSIKGENVMVKSPENLVSALSKASLRDSSSSSEGKTGIVSLKDSASSHVSPSLEGQGHGNRT